MAKKTFALELKDGVEVKTIEELRENFDLEKVVAYFKEGKLLEWLEDHFYDDEAEAVEAISTNDKNAAQKICAALNVECDEDLEFTQRIREKKAILSEKTDDKTIIDNATTTAMNQDDLANLLHMDYKKIYLCGEQFNVPIRMTDMNYIGILGTPKIKIKANSDEELETKNIKFENCKLPWTKESSIEQLKVLVEKIFQNNGKWNIVKNGEIVSTYDKLDKTEKALSLKMVCKGKYTEDQIAYMQLTDDLSMGFALTIDSFCAGGEIENSIIKYTDIKETEIHNYTDYGTGIQIKTEADHSGMKIRTEVNHSNHRWGVAYYDHHYKQGSIRPLFGSSKKIYNNLKKFLDVVKNL